MPIDFFLEFRRLIASVEVEGNELPCYAISVDKKERSASCWIASEESKCFSVTLERGIFIDCSIRISLFLDGREVSHQYSKRLGYDSLYIQFRTVKAPDGTRRTVMFAPLEVTDDDKYLDSVLLSSDNIQKIGEITLKVHRVIHLKYTTKNVRDRKPRHRSASDAPQIQKVHESLNKSERIPHQIGYGPEIESVDDSSETYTSISHGGVKELLASFTFRYRPFETLRSCGIIPHVILRSMQTRDARGQRSQIPEPQSPCGNQPEMVHNGEVHREASLDDFYVPLTSEPAVSIGAEDSNTPGKKNLTSDTFHLDVKEIKHELSSDDDYQDENDDEIKALQARTEMLLAEKRKRREALHGPSKRFKREERPMTFFRPGEIQEVIDLT